MERQPLWGCNKGVAELGGGWFRLTSRALYESQVPVRAGTSAPVLLKLLHSFTLCHSTKTKGQRYTSDVTSTCPIEPGTKSKGVEKEYCGLGKWGARNLLEKILPEVRHIINSPS